MTAARLKQRDIGHFLNLFEMFVKGKNPASLFLSDNGYVAVGEIHRLSFPLKLVSQPFRH